MWRDKAVEAGLGQAWPGVDRRSWLGKDWLVGERTGLAVEASQLLTGSDLAGRSWNGVERHGMARLGRAVASWKVPEW